MGEVQTWSLNKGEGATENTYISDISNARMLAFDWLGQCLYWAGKANTVGITALLNRKKTPKVKKKDCKIVFGKLILTSGNVRCI